MITYSAFVTHGKRPASTARNVCAEINTASAQVASTDTYTVTGVNEVIEHQMTTSSISLKELHRRTRYLRLDDDNTRLASIDADCVTVDKMLQL